MDDQTSSRAAPERVPPERVPPARAPLPDAWWNLPLRTRQLIAGGIAVVLLVIGAVVVSSLFGGEDADEAEEPEAVVFVAALPDERVALWDELAECESESRWDLDAGNGFFGGLQFTQVSWEGVGGFGSPANASREEQIMRGEMLYDLQGWGAWPNCSAQLGLG